MLLLCWAILSTAPAATIVVDNLATDFHGQSALIHATNTVHLDLSRFGDLAPGEPIRLTLSATAPLLWLGGFWLGETGVSFEHNAVLELTVGADSVSASYSWRVPEIGFMDPGPQPPNTSNIVGFVSGPRPDDLSLVVPWGTDLSDVQVTLVEDCGPLARALLFRNRALRSPDRPVRSVRHLCSTLRASQSRAR